MKVLGFCLRFGRTKALYNVDCAGFQVEYNSTGWDSADAACEIWILGQQDIFAVMSGKHCLKRKFMMSKRV